MAIDLKGLLDDLSKLPIPGVSQAAGALSAIVGKPETPEQKAAIAAVLDQHEKNLLEEQRISQADIAGADAVETAMLTSEDKWTKRARPTAVYGAIASTLFLVGVEGYCLVTHTVVDYSAILAILALIGPMWGHSVSYSRDRRLEKIAQAA